MKYSFWNPSANLVFVIWVVIDFETQLSLATYVKDKLHIDKISVTRSTNELQ